MKLRGGPKIEDCPECQEFMEQSQFIVKLGWELYEEGLKSHYDRHRMYVTIWEESIYGRKIQSIQDPWTKQSYHDTMEKDEFVHPDDCRLCETFVEKMEEYGRKRERLKYIVKHATRHQKYENYFRYKWEVQDWKDRKNAIGKVRHNMNIDNIPAELSEGERKYVDRMLDMAKREFF